MDRPISRWVWVGLSCLIVASAACREREPAPRHNCNLGDEGQYLLPTPARDVGPELPGNRGIEIPDRSEAGAIAIAAEADAAGEGKGVISSFLSRLKGAAGGGAPARADREAEEE